MIDEQYNYIRQDIASLRASLDGQVRDILYELKALKDEQERSRRDSLRLIEDIRNQLVGVASLVRAIFDWVRRLK